jgi:hypothetical protein
MSGVRGFVLGAVTIAVVYGAYVWLTTPHTITDAIAKNLVTAQTAFGGLDSSSTITVTRASGSSGSLTVAVPAGTVMLSSDAEAQRVMTTEAVTLTIPAGSDSATAQVRTYCLDEFAPVPPLQSTLIFAGSTDTRRVSEEETEPLHRLADCLERSSLNSEDKQIAVWAVHDDLLHKTVSQALAFLSAGFERQLQRDLEAKVAGNRSVIRAAAPHLSDDEVEAQIQSAMQDERTANRQQAAQMADRQLENLRRHDREALLSCDYQVNLLAVFN